MKFLLIARLNSYIDAPPEEFVWDFGDKFEQAQRMHDIWTALMFGYDWNFREFGEGETMTMIKPGGISELDLRSVGDRL